MSSAYLCDRGDLPDDAAHAALSWACTTCFAFIHDYPHRVKLLVLSCSGVSGGDPHQTPCSKDVLNRLANSGATLEEKADTLVGIFFHPEYLAKHPETRNILLQNKSAPQPEHAYRAQLKACVDPRPYYQRLAEIQVLVLVIHGDEDQVWPVQKARTLIEGLGMNSELFIMEKAGHVLMVEKPEEFNRRIESFLRTPLVQHKL